VKLTHAQIVQTADELTNAIKNWRLIDHRGEFFVFCMPDGGVTNIPSAADGESMPFWRFDTRHAAERFRNRKIIVELATLALVAA
jgi:hypothetical protein